MKRLRKIALWVVGIALTLFAVGWLGLHWYLNSAGGRRLVADKLTAMLGLPVEVRSLGVGFRSTSIALTIPDSTAPTSSVADSSAHLLRVDSIDTDLTLGGLLTGHTTPTRITVHGADFVLRLNDKRDIVSPMPKLESGGGVSKIPAVAVTDARVRIQQPGKPEFDVRGVSAELVPGDAGAEIRGNISDPVWGEWRIDGRLAADPSDGRVTLSCANAKVNDDLLHRVPFVPMKVWKHLSVSGATAVDVALAFQSSGKFRYAVDVKPKAADVTLPDADITVTGVTGDIRIADGKVVAERGRLALAGGSAAIDGTFEFDRDDYLLNLKTTASGIDVQQLPPTWGLPKSIEGKLKGDAALEVRMGDKVETHGGGTGEIEGAKLAGFPAEIKLRLKGGGGRYQFENEPPK